MSDWIPSLNALRAFEAVARHGSYKLAATELNVTPAAVKQLVVKLERALGVQLMQRRGHRLVLTSHGSAGLSDLSLAMRHMSQAVQQMRTAAPPNRLIVTVETSIATAWLVPKLQSFRAAHPNIDVLIDSNQKIVDLNASDVDVAIRYGVAPEKDLCVARLFEDLIVPACAPSLAQLIASKHIRPSLKDFPLIHWDLSQIPWATETMKWHSWDTWLKHAGISYVNTEKGLRFSDYGMAYQAAASGQGLILAGLPVLQDQIEAGLLVCPFADLRVTTAIGYDVVTTRDASNRADVQAFVHWLLDVASRYGGLFEGGQTRPLDPVSRV